MSPEQARGQAVDKRTDVWAFGRVLLRCCRSAAHLPGDTISDTLVSVLERNPDWAALPAETPVPIRTLLERCLRKDPRLRLHDIADARIELAPLKASPNRSLRRLVREHGTISGRVDRPTRCVDMARASSGDALLR
jgi:serine/threonine protein kinase